LNFILYWLVDECQKSETVAGSQLAGRTLSVVYIKVLTVCSVGMRCFVL